MALVRNNAYQVDSNLYAKEICWKFYYEKQYLIWLIFKVTINQFFLKVTFQICPFVFLLD